MLPGEAGDAVNTSNTITAGLEYEITVTINIVTAPITADGMELHFGGCTFNFTTSGTFTVYCTATVSGQLYWTHDPTDTTLEACVGVLACQNLNADPVEILVLTDESNVPIIANGGAILVT